MTKKNRKNKDDTSVEFLTVYTDVCNPPYSCFWPDAARYMGKHWVDFTVPTKWLMENLGLKSVTDISLRLADFSVDKERVLIDAINDGVVNYGW